MRDFFGFPRFRDIGAETNAATTALHSDSFFLCPNLKGGVHVRRLMRMKHFQFDNHLGAWKPEIKTMTLSSSLQKSTMLHILMVYFFLLIPLL